MDLGPRARAGVKYTREHLLHLVSELFFESSYVPINQITSVSKRFNSICYRASLRAFLLFNVSERDEILYFFYLLFSNLLFEVICSITDLTASFLLPSAGISGEGGEDCRDKADAQSRFLWRD